MNATPTAAATAPESLTFIPMAVALQHRACASPRPGKKPHKSKLYRWVAAGLVRHEYRGSWLFICQEDLDARCRMGVGRQAKRVVGCARNAAAAAAERREAEEERKRSEEWTRATLGRFYGRKK